MCERLWRNTRGVPSPTRSGETISRGRNQGVFQILKAKELRNPKEREKKKKSQLDGRLCLEK